MSYPVQLERHASAFLETCPPQLQRRLVRRLQALADNPYRGAAKLEGTDGFRVRVGDYRILFTVDQAANRVRVWRIGHRRSVYRGVA